MVEGEAGPRNYNYNCNRSAADRCCSLYTIPPVAVNRDTNKIETTIHENKVNRPEGEEIIKQSSACCSYPAVLQGFSSAAPARGQEQDGGKGGGGGRGGDPVVFIYCSVVCLTPHAPPKHDPTPRSAPLRLGTDCDIVALHRRTE